MDEGDKRASMEEVLQVIDQRVAKTDVDPEAADDFETHQDVEVTWTEEQELFAVGKTFSGRKGCVPSDLSFCSPCCVLHHTKRGELTQVCLNMAVIAWSEADELLWAELMSRCSVIHADSSMFSLCCLMTW